MALAERPIAPSAPNSDDFDREPSVFEDLGYSRPVTGEVPVVKVSDSIGEPAVTGQVKVVEAPVTHLDDWRLTEGQIAVGRRGIAQARAALRSARADHLDQQV